MKYCPYCGAVLPDGAFSFCPACGKALPERAKKEKMPKSTKARKRPKPVPEPPEDDYDGYYNDRIPLDAGKRREGLDFGIVKKVIAVVACLLDVIGACVALLYVL